MKKKTSGVVKGAPSGFLISLLIHAAAFLLAGMLVVFNVVKKEEKKFVPPKPVDRPKMKLRKPKVKVKKTSKPKPSTRIVTKVKRASMPDIQLPEMGGMGAALGEGIGGFELMPDLQDMSQFGTAVTTGSDLVGTFYDFNRSRTGTALVTDPIELAGLISKFLTRSWSPNVFSQYYRSPNKLYSTSIAMPPLQSTQAPTAFGEDDGQAWCWLVHYTGKLVYDQDIRFRFWGFGDDILAVRVNKEIKFMACFPEWVTDFDEHTAHLWQSSSADNRKYPMGNHHSVVGDWITLKAGEAQDLEILIGESHGGVFAAMLMVEVEGVEYPRNPHRNGPMLPFFKTAEFSKDMTELIYSQLHPGEATCEMGPVFNDYDSVSPTSIVEVVYAPQTNEAPVHISSITPELRIWKKTDGKDIEARYKTMMGKSVVLETSRGKQIRIDKKDLSPEDLTYVTLLTPPKFKMDLAKTSNQRKLPQITIWLDYAERRLQVSDWQFGARLKQSSSFNGYDRPLTVEYIVVGDEEDGKNHVLLDRKSETFVPTEDNKGIFEFLGDEEVETKLEALADGGMRGTKYGGYIITVTDELGRIVQYTTTDDFLYENLGNLRNIPKGKHFDDTCNRVMPARPREEDRFTATL